MLGKAPHFLARASISMLPAKVHNHPRTLLAFCANKENDEPMSQYSGKFSSYWDDIIGDALCSWKNQHNLTLLFAVFFSTDDQIFVDSPYENLQIDVAEYDLEEDLCLHFEVENTNRTFGYAEFYCRIVSKYDCALSIPLAKVWDRQD